MTRSHSAALTACVLTLVAAAPQTARAQFSAASLGVAGGLAVPVGRLGDNVNAGYTVAGLLDFHPVPGPVSARLEVGYDRFETKSSLLDDVSDRFGGGVSANSHFLRGTANLVLRLQSVSGLRPYLTGGVGVYQIGGSLTVRANGTTITQSDDNETKFGINGGVGLELPLTGISVFLEARAHGVQTDANPVTYIPITVGIRF